MNGADQDLQPNSREVDVLLFELMGADNDGWAFEDAGGPRCSSCQRLLKKWENLPVSVPDARTKYDLAFTHDGLAIASTRFRDVFSAESLVGLEFFPLTIPTGMYAVMAQRTICVDAAASRVVGERLCVEGSRYREVTLAGRLRLRPGQEVAPNEVVRTDVEFCSNHEQMPWLVCGKRVADVLTKVRLKGVELTPI